MNDITDPRVDRKKTYDVKLARVWEVTVTIVTGLKLGFHPTQRTQRSERKSREKRKLQPIETELSYSQLNSSVWG